MSDELQHYGVKGMKWGVRKEKSSNTSTKSEYKSANKEFRKNTADVMDYRIDQVFNRKAISREAYNSLSSKDSIIKRGHELTRITKNSDEKTDIRYVSTNVQDAKRYRAVLINKGLFGNIDKIVESNKEVTLKAMVDLKSPSDKARVDSFIELMSTPSIETGGKALTGREWLSRSGFKKDVKKLDDLELGLKFYEDFTQSQGMQKSPLNSAYFKKLRDKGYNALKDDNDRGIVAEDPWIILDGTNTLKKIREKSLSVNDVIDAKRDYRTPDSFRTRTR